ncbi:hypothetical protein BDF22DRAFT_741933 [Syncephalis plumigaleata]|nr:hypothetical protein BDF22DRAFT_741933 [Syncephalis plumigaleata]
MPNIRSGELFTTALLPSIDNVQRTDSTNGNSGFQFPPPPELPPRRNSPPPMQEQQQQPPSPQQVQQQMQQQVQQYNPSIASTGSSGSNSNRNGFMDTMKEKFPRNTGAKSTTKSISPSLYKTIGKGRDWAKLQVFGTPSNPSNP